MMRRSFISHFAFLVSHYEAVGFRETLIKSQSQIPQEILYMTSS